MPVDTKHPDLDTYLERWKLVRDAVEGEWAIKEAGEEYLPRLYEQENDAYDNYRKRAIFLNVTGRTLDAFVGFMFRKAPAQKSTEGIGKYAEDVDMRGNSILDWGNTVAREVVSVGRFGTLVDWSKNESRPFFSNYRAESIINWKTRRINGRQVLSLLVLHEISTEFIATPGATQAPDEYSQDQYDQWRVLKLQDSYDGDGVNQPYVVVEVWRRKQERRATKASKDISIPGTGNRTGSDQFILVEQIFPARRGIGINEIPFIFHASDENGSDIGKLPLEDIARINIAHYRGSADIENARHMVGVPTPYIFGVDTEKDKLVLGTSECLTSTKSDAKAGFLELNGSSLSELREGQKEKEEQMASLGARMLDSRQKDAEAAETVRLRASSESSVLSKIAGHVSKSITRAIRWFQWWGSTQDSPNDVPAELVINKDFLESRLPADQITALVAAYNGNTMSLETLFWNYQQGELLPPDRTFEEEKAAIQANPPIALLAPPVDPNRTPPTPED